MGDASRDVDLSEELIDLSAGQWSLRASMAVNAPVAALIGISSHHDRREGNLVITDLFWTGKTVWVGASSIAVGGDVHEDAHHGCDGWGEYRLCFVDVADGTGSGARPRGSGDAGRACVSGNASDARDACVSGGTGGSRHTGMG
jgi:hypothetical protein